MFSLDICLREMTKDLQLANKSICQSASIIAEKKTIISVIIIFLFYF